MTPLDASKSRNLTPPLRLDGSSLSSALPMSALPGTASASAFSPCRAGEFFHPPPPSHFPSPFFPLTPSSSPFPKLLNSAPNVSLEQPHLFYCSLAVSLSSTRLSDARGSLDCYIESRLPRIPLRPPYPFSLAPERLSRLPQSPPIPSDLAGMFLSLS